MRTLIPQTKSLKIVLLLVVSAFVLAACGAVQLNNWPGLTAVDGTVYMAQSQVRAINLTNGTELWHYPEKVDANNITFGAPLVTADKVIVGNYHNVVTALDAKNKGAVLWTFKDFEAKGRFIGRPTLAGDLVLVGSTDKVVYALDVNTGKLVWSFKARDAVWSAVTSDDRFAYVSGMDHYFYALDLKTGQKSWEINLDGPMIVEPVVGENNLVYVATMADELVAIDVEKQAVAWRMDTTGKTWGAPLLHEGTLYFGTDKNKAYAVNAATGSAVWSFDATAPIVAAPVFLGDRFVFASEDGQVFAMTAAGAQDWKQTVKGKPYSSPAVTPELMVVGGVEMEFPLVAFNAQGAQVWTFTAPK
ncbi:MAG: PQQ-binding-like beta-propeller repeat protein [Anaerolineae bacterium]|nr:PQQ-binding-like beta-propeller repeat protein [Anaerolineae bacterium]